MGKRVVLEGKTHSILPKARRGDAAGYNFTAYCGRLRPSAQRMADVIVNIESLDNEGRGIARADGKAVFDIACMACHQADGKGLPGAFPPLARSDYMLADRDRAVRTVLKGMTGPVTVNGVTFNSAMPPQEAVLTDAQIADVLTYVYNSWGNTGDAFKAEQVKAIRNEQH